MALWCVLTRQSPDVYHAITRLEREAFVTVIKQANRK